MKVTNPATGAVTAPRALGAKRVSVITPHTIANTASVLRLLTGEGFDTDMGIGSVPTAAYLRRAKTADHGDAEAIFVSCTATTALDAATGLPCVTSNQAAFWHASQLAAWNEPIEGFGKLPGECWN